MVKIYYEDVDVGEVRDLGSFQVSKNELKRFAEQYDPQPIHVDEAMARNSVYDGIIASGWHTASSCMRLLVDDFLSDAASMGSFGLDELRWSAPVRPGETISARSEITDKRESSSRDDRGYVQSELVAHNQNDKEVIFWRGTNIFNKRK